MRRNLREGINRQMCDTYTYERKEMDILGKQNSNPISITNRKKESLKRKDVLEYKREILGNERSKQHKRELKKNRKHQNYESFKGNQQRLNDLLLQDPRLESAESILQIPTPKDEGYANLMNGQTRTLIDDGNMKIDSDMVNLKREFVQTYEEVKSMSQREIPNQRGIVNVNNTMAEVSGVPVEWEDSHIQKYFDPELSQITNIQRIKDSTGRNTDRCLLTFKRDSQKETFISKFHGDFIHSNIAVERVSVKNFVPKRRADQLKVYRSAHQVEVYNLPYEMTYIEVYELLGQYGEIVELQMPMRTENRSKGFALVLFKGDEKARQCCEGLENFFLFGRQIKARQKYVSFDTQQKRISTKSDSVIRKAQYEEVSIRGKFFKSYVQSRDYINSLSFEF